MQNLLKLIQQEQQGAKGKNIKPLYDPNMIRYEFLKKINEICIAKSYGKKPFEFNKENKVVVELVCQYLNKEIAFEKNGRSLDKGLWICGNFGSGKTIIMETYLAMKRKMNANITMNSCNDMNMYFLEIDKFTNKQKRYDGISKFANKYDKSERIFDDLGEEEITLNDYGNKVCIMAYILGERYKGSSEGAITHVTTNLTNDMISEDYGGRIESRVMSMFNLIKLGASVDSIDYRKK